MSDGTTASADKTGGGADAGTARPTALDPEAAAFAADPELAGMFVADALDHLGTIEAVLLKLETAPGDAKLLNDLFRPFHTVKGNAGVLGLTSLQEIAHKVETLLDLARSGQRAVGRAEIDIVLEAVDLLSVMTQELRERAAGRPGAELSGRRGALITAVDALIAAPSPPAPAADTAPAAAVPEPGNTASDIDATPQRRWDDRQSTVKVNTKKLDNLVDLVGELVIAQSILAEAPALAHSTDDRLNRQIAQIKRITSELQRQAMAMRMVPIRQTFQKMERVVHDLSRRLSKPIDFIASGEETELDRKVVEAITDPLLHMVRNTVDHGIEPADVRAAAGKSPRAELRLRACHQAGAIVIEIADDGAGLNTAKILEKGIALGLVRADESLTTDEIHQLIFRPGFSTAERVTDLSGRGVGMDVVRRNIEALRGRIEVRTAQGVGTTVTLRLPLTLATIDGLLLLVGGERFVIPTFAVRESLRVSPTQVHSISGKTCLVRVRDRLIPVLHLGQLFGIERARAALDEGTIVIIEDNARQVALVVDEMLGKQDVVIKSLGDVFQHVRGIAGGAILGDGRIGLILDAGGLLSFLETAPLHAVA